MHGAQKASGIYMRQLNPLLTLCAELFARALKCDSNHAETLLNYANFLDANDELEQGVCVCVCVCVCLFCSYPMQLCGCYDLEPKPILNTLEYAVNRMLAFAH